MQSRRALTLLAFLVVVAVLVTVLLSSWPMDSDGLPGIDRAESHQQALDGDTRSHVAGQEDAPESIAREVPRTEVAPIGAISLLDSMTREPVSAIRVTFARHNREFTRTTDPFGRVRLPVGHWRIEALTDRWSAEDRDVKVPAPPASAILWVGRLTDLSVLVETTWGEPLPDALVCWYPGKADGMARPIPRPARSAKTDGRGIAGFSGWHGQPGRFSVAAAEHRMAVVPIRGPVQDDLLRVALRPIDHDKTFTVHFVHRDGTPAKGVRLDTSGGRTIQCDDQGRLLVDETVLSELPLGVAKDQGYFPVRMESLTPEESIILPRCLQSRLVIVGGDDRHGFQIERQWVPDRGDGFEIQPERWTVEARATPLVIPAGTSCSILGADGFGACGRVDLAGSFHGGDVVLRIDDGPKLRIRVTGSAASPPASDPPIAEVRYLTIDDGFQMDSHLRVHPTTGDILEIPRPGEVFRIRVQDASHAPVKLRHKSRDPTDLQAAGGVTVALQSPVTSTVRVVSTDGEPVAGLSVRIDSTGPPEWPIAMALPTDHPEWLLMPPDRQEQIVDGRGESHIAAIPGWYRISVQLPEMYPGRHERTGLYRDASRRVQLPSESAIEITVPPVIFREIRVRERWSGLPVSRFDIHGPDNAWKVAVEGSQWQGWTHDEALTVTVPGLGSAEVDANAGNPAVLEVEAESPCRVRFHGWSKAAVSGVSLITLRPRDSVHMAGMDESLVKDGGWLPIHLPPGTRFRLQVDTPRDTLTTPVFEWRQGTVYEFSLDGE